MIYAKVLAHFNNTIIKINTIPNLWHNFTYIFDTCMCVPELFAICFFNSLISQLYYMPTRCGVHATGLVTYMDLYIGMHATTLTKIHTGWTEAIS